MESLVEVFRDEAAELLTDLESTLLEFERTPDEPVLIDRIFRALHTIKGSGAMAGVAEVSVFAHEVEAVYAAVRNHSLAAGPELIRLTLAACDRMRQMMNALRNNEPLAAGENTLLIEAFRSFLPENGTGGTESQPAPVHREECATYRIRFQPGRDLFRRGINPLCLLRELALLGDCQVIAQTDAIPVLEKLDPQDALLYWDILLTTNQGKDAIADVFIFVADDCTVQIETIDAPWFEDEANRKLGEILVERGDLSPAALQTALAEHRRIGEILVEKELATPGKIASALAEQMQVRSRREARREEDVINSIRVRSTRLDSLVDLIGELVTVQARLSRAAEVNSDTALLAISEDVERLTMSLRDQVLTIRMLPIGATFNKFRRLVHDLAAELGKSVQLVTEGAETELDKTVIERLNDPLIHLIRNAVDHGIESPDQRLAAGKPALGTIRLSAAHNGASVELQISDDGAGIDRERVRKKAEESGLIPPGAEIGDQELLRCIFSAGFSTVENVTEVSGRGVGMDVVRQAIDGLRAEIEIRSLPGEGTTFIIRLPLTLAIIDGLLVRIGAEDYILPLASIVECIELTAAERSASCRQIVSVRGEIVPYLRLRDCFSIRGSVPPVEQIVVADINGLRLGFVVDYVVGSHQTVIKNLGRFYRKVRGVSGATILGDGRVALILDPPTLCQLAREAEARLSARSA